MGKKGNTLYLLDTLIVLLNIAGGRGNYLLYGLLHTQKTITIPTFVILVDIAYLFVRQGNISESFLRSKYNRPIFMVLALLAINPFFSGSLLAIEYLIQACLFFLVLCKIGSNSPLLSINHQIGRLSRGYIWLSLISLFGVFLSYILLSTIGIRRIPLAMDYMTANASNGAIYVLSYFSVSIFDPSVIRVPIFQDYGILCGLFHEPHIFAYNVFPCLILLLGLSRSYYVRLFVVVSALLAVLFSGSATNVLSVVICVMVYFILRVRVSFWKSMISVAIILVLVLFYISTDTTLYDFVLGRMDSDNRSQQYSLALLQFAFTPRTLLGTGFLDTSFVDDFIYNQHTNADVGIIPFTFNLLFVLFFITNMVRLLLRKEKLAFAIGMASLYFICHSAKVGITLVLQTLPIFIVFLQTIALMYYGRIKDIKLCSTERKRTEIV